MLDEEYPIPASERVGRESSQAMPPHELASNTTNLHQVGIVQKPSSDKDLVDTFSVSNHMGPVASEGDQVGYENRLPTRP